MTRQSRGRVVNHAWGFDYNTRLAGKLAMCYAMCNTRLTRHSLVRPGPSSLLLHCRLRMRCSVSSTPCWPPSNRHIDWPTLLTADHEIRRLGRIGLLAVCAGMLVQVFGSSISFPEEALHTGIICFNYVDLGT